MREQGSGNRDQGTVSRDNSNRTPHSPNPSIPGVNVQNGIAMTGGTTALYRQVLTLFCKDAEERMLLLQAVPDADTLPSFITQVHALKSAASSIGAEEFSAEAARLEAAGKSGDLAFVQENSAGFTGRLAELAKNIRAALEIYDGEFCEVKVPSCPAKPDSTSLISHSPLFNELAGALESRNAAEIDRLLENIKKLFLKKPPDLKSRESLEQISDHVLMAEYENALKIAREISRQT